MVRLRMRLIIPGAGIYMVTVPSMNHVPAVSMKKVRANVTKKLLGLYASRLKKGIIVS